MSHGYNFGAGRHDGAVSLTETVHAPDTGVSLRADGFELLTRGGELRGWYACVLDACAAMKRMGGPGRIVRCADRAVIKVRYARRWRS